MDPFLSYFQLIFALKPLFFTLIFARKTFHNFFSPRGSANWLKIANIILKGQKREIWVIPSGKWSDTRKYTLNLANYSLYTPHQKPVQEENLSSCTLLLFLLCDQVFSYPWTNTKIMLKLWVDTTHVFLLLESISHRKLYRVCRGDYWKLLPSLFWGGTPIQYHPLFVSKIN